MMTMRVVFIGQDSSYSLPALEKVLAANDSWKVALAVEGLRRARGLRRHRLIKPGNALGSTDLSEFSRTALRGGVPVLRTAGINENNALEHIRRFRPDLLVCVGFDRLFGPELLGIASQGGINAHPSLLPRWRGPAPLFWAARNGERELGVTVHRLDRLEDHGPIYAQDTFRLRSGASTEDIYADAGKLAAQLLERVLAELVAGKAVATPQNNSSATRAPRPRPEDVEVIPADWTCEDLINFTNIAPFFRSPWLRLGDDIFFIRRGLNWRPTKRMGGEYILKGSLLCVGCSDGVIELEIQT